MEDIKIVNSIKGLSIDMINKAGSGHPGVALGAAPIIYTLYSRHLNIDLEDDKWINVPKNNKVLQKDINAQFDMVGQ